MRILLVEDQSDLAEVLQTELKKQFSVDQAQDGKQALYLLELNEYDLIILDVGLPDMSGDSISTHLREAGNPTPILMLTGNDGVTDKVRSFEAGADDYLTKPFSMIELVARIRALLRRSRDAHFIPAVVNIGDLTVNMNNRQVTRAGKEIPLRRKEYDLLEYLVRHEGQVVTRGMILEHVWDSSAELFTNAVDVHIKHLRDKVDRPYETQLIKTVHGLGYKIEVVH